MKRTWFQAQIKKDIAISTQCEHERHSTHKRGSYSIFTKRKPSTSIYIYSKATKRIVIHLISIISNVITSYLATLMALVLSHMRGTWEHSSSKSLSVYVIQSSYEHN
jgi:hypothetical protein